MLLYSQGILDQVIFGRQTTHWIRLIRIYSLTGNLMVIFWFKHFSFFIHSLSPFYIYLFIYLFLSIITSFPFSLHFLFFLTRVVPIIWYGQVSGITPDIWSTSDIQPDAIYSVPGIWPKKYPAHSYFLHLP